MSSLRYETTIAPQDEITAPIHAGLSQHSHDVLGDYSFIKIAFTAHEGDQIVGGLVAELFWDWLHVGTLWVDQAHRGQDIGTQLMHMAEQAALEQGITKSHLETTSFQALDFYRKNGYEVFGQLDGKPAGHTWYYLKKEQLT